MDDDVYDAYVQAGEVSSKAREMGISMIAPGVKYLDVAEEVTDYILENADGLAFPVNISVNEIAAHYSPTHDDPLEFRVGDLVKFDVGAQVDGYIGDTAKTVEVGSGNWTSMIEAAEEGLHQALGLMRPGVNIGRVGEVVQKTIESRGFRPIRNLTGHLLGQYSLHGNQAIPNIRENTEAVIQEDSVFAVEPFSTNGEGLVKDHRRSNIYRFLKTKDMKKAELNEMVEVLEGTNGLPFSERLLSRVFPEPGRSLKKLVAKGVLHSYPKLREVTGGFVAQAEHTIMILEGESRITTL